jgi:hypothetical protein
MEPFLICALPTLFFGKALTAAIDVPPSAKNSAMYATAWPRTCLPIFLMFPSLVPTTDVTLQTESRHAFFHIAVASAAQDPNG